MIDNLYHEIEVMRGKIVTKCLRVKTEHCDIY
jgi:hypothetical protein